MKPKVNILIVEDNQLFREGLKSLLASNTDYELIAEAQDGLEALRQVRKKRPDFILLDLSMPRLSGISVIKEIKSISRPVENQEDIRRIGTISSKFPAIGQAIADADHPNRSGRKNLHQSPSHGPSDGRLFGEFQEAEEKNGLGHDYPAGKGNFKTSRRRVQKQTNRRTTSHQPENRRETPCQYNEKTGFAQCIRIDGLRD